MTRPVTQRMLIELPTGWIARWRIRRKIRRYWLKQHREWPRSFFINSAPGGLIKRLDEGGDR